MKFEKIIIWLGLIVSILFVIGGLGMSEHLVITLIEEGKDFQTAINSFVLFIVLFSIMGIFALLSLTVFDKKLPKGYTQDEYNFCKDNDIRIS